MSRVTGKPPTSNWRRPITRTYDYNMSLSENYYKPQLDYITSRKSRGKTPPSAATFAERLLHFTPSRRSASATRREDEVSSEYRGTTSAASSSTAAAESSLGRYASLDDLGLDEDFTRRRRQLLIDASQENLGADRGVSPLLSPSIGGKNRVTFGDKVLDAVGVREVGGSYQSSSKLTTQRQVSEEDAFDKILAERRSRRQQGLLGIQSAEADLYTEDPLKSSNVSSRLQNARQELDAMRDEMRVKDAESNTGTSRFRQRLRAKREKEMRDEQHDQLFGGSLSSALNEVGATSSSTSAASKARQFLADSSSTTTSSSAAASKARQFLAENSSSANSATSGRSVSAQQLKTKVVSSSAQNLFDDDDSDIAATLNKVNQIRQRAKARLAQISDEDFPDLTIGSSLAARRAERKLEDDDEYSSSFRLANNSSSTSGGRSVAISKRAVKASYDFE